MVMKSLTVLLATITLLAEITASHAAVRIVDDPGGRIGTYVERYEGMRSSGERVIIDGYCASACTIVLGTIPHDRICVTSRARLGFHAAWDPGANGRKITNPEATQRFGLWMTLAAGLEPTSTDMKACESRARR